VNSRGAAAVAVGAAAETSGAPLLAGTPWRDAPRALVATAEAAWPSAREACKRSEKVPASAVDGPPATAGRAACFPGLAAVSALGADMVLDTSTRGPVCFALEQGNRGTTPASDRLAKGNCKCKKKRDLLMR
jgi:hypothetical protein